MASITMPVGESNHQAFKPGDRVAVERDGATICGRVLMIRQTGYLQCLMDGEAGLMIVDPSAARLDPQYACPRPQQPYLSR